MTYRLTPLAIDHLKDIESYTSTTWGIEQTILYTGDITKCFAMLASNPRAGRIIDDSATQNIRKFPLKHHTVIYRIVGDDIEILAIPKAERDPANYLRS